MMAMTPMTAVERLLRDLRSTYDGDAWHGTPLRALFEDLDDARADAHPIAGARSIKELLAHVISWNETAARWVAGEVYNPTREVDFPSVRGVPLASLVARLDLAHSRLVDQVAALREEDLDRITPTRTYTIDFMLRGLIHHNTYHAAQIVMLMKMV